MTDQSSLAICGGIMINCEGEGNDRFLPLKFELRKLSGTEDLYEEAFGRRPKNYLTEELHEMTEKTQVS